jgi:hypothetical protein
MEGQHTLRQVLVWHCLIFGVKCSAMHVVVVVVMSASVWPSSASMLHCSAWPWSLLPIAPLCCSARSVFLSFSTWCGGSARPLLSQCCSAWFRSSLGVIPGWLFTVITCLWLILEGRSTYLATGQVLVWHCLTCWVTGPTLLMLLEMMLSAAVSP